VAGNILLERSLPLNWSVQPPQGANVDTEHNQLVLSLLDTVEDSASRNTEHESSPEWLRVETKLNVIMQLLGQLLQARQPLPPTVDIRFTSDTLSWQVDTPPPPGSLLAVSVYPESSMPMPVQFLARVVGSESSWLEVDMHGLSEDQQAIWSRWIFRQHRRQIAQSRATDS
jgi:hypothetical protein